MAKNVQQKKEDSMKEWLTSGATAHEGAPPPSVVLDCQLEVGERDGDEGRHDDQDDEDDEEDGVDGVHLVAPHAGKDVVELDVDGGEGQEACHQHLGDGLAVPGQRGHLPRVLGRAAGCIELHLHQNDSISTSKHCQGLLKVQIGWKHDQRRANC